MKNLVLLTAKEHYVAHLLLTRMTSGQSRQKMVFAFWRMVHGKQHRDRYSPSGRRYQIAKEAMVVAITAQNRGQIVTEKQKELLRRKIPWNKGKQMSLGFGDKIRQARIGKTASEDTKRKISNGVRRKTRLDTDGSNKNLGPRPRMEFELINTNTREIEITSNLKDWCKNKGFSSALIYLGKSEWKIVRKIQLKTGDVIS